MKEKIKIAVLTGGNSSEAEISLKSADNVINNLSSQKYEIYKVVIKGTDWTAYDCNNNKFKVDKNDFSVNGKKFDLAFPVIHGTPGEDGQLQGYLQAMKIPFTGSSQLTSALTFNKYFCNQYLRNYDVKMANSLLIRKGQTFDVKQILKTVGLPCFVKPNEGGSSFGISKVKREEDFELAVQQAFAESDELMVEQFIEGKEFTCGLFKTKKKSCVFTPVEIVSKNEFFDYAAKYNSNYNEEIIPARLLPEQTKNIQDISSEIYDHLNCKGIVRMDYILKDNMFYFLEVNTIPGTTAESIVPKMIKYEGMNYGQIADLIIADLLNI